MIFVAIAAVVLLGALALAVDWGYGLAQRRVMQTSSDAAALGVGRLLATSVQGVEGGGTVFISSQEQAWCAADHYVNENRSFRPQGATPTFTLELGGKSEPIAWTPVTAVVDPADCGTDQLGSTEVPRDTRYVRIRAEITYRSLIAQVIGFPMTTAAASSRAKLSGAAVPEKGPVWPMVRHYDPSDFLVSCPPDTCNPTTVDPLTFWSPNETDTVYGNFKGLVDLSRDSSRFNDGTGQLLEAWDESGSSSGDPPTPLKADMSANGQNCATFWDTAGGEDPQLHDRQCSIPNWFYYSFEGALSLESPWVGAPPEGQEAPTPLTHRIVCDGTERPDPAPSCDNAVIGDWVETAYGDVGSNMSNNMRARIQDQGFEGTFSDRIIESGPNKGERFGKALTVLIYLWDCAETYKQGEAGNEWTLIVAEKGPGANDCSQVPRTGNAPTPDRVHLFTYAPFTFYENLVSSQKIQGYWGGVFGEPTSCTDCDLNPLSNTTFLVSDDDYHSP